MTRLLDIRGQERAIGKLARAIEAGRVAHAYLFCGPSRCGKHTTGLALARALNCLHHPGQGCAIDPNNPEAACPACTRIADGIHPDVQTLERKGAAQIIPIATIRDELIPQLALPPHEARARIYLIEEATSLQDAAANALLKTLEEPPARTHFVLATTAPENLLPTIRSRCQRINFAALPTELRAQLRVDDDDAAGKLEELVQTMRKAIAGGDSASLHDAAREVSSERANLDPVLEMLSQSLHRDARALAADHQLAPAAALARQAMQILDTRQALAGNAHAHTALEALLHNLRIAL